MANDLETARLLPSNGHHGVTTKAGGEGKVQSIQLDWESIGLTVDQPLEQRRSLLRPFGQAVATVQMTILSNVSGTASAGETLAIMGPSGAGKTSLLNVLTGRMNNFEGRVLVNGTPASQGYLRSLSVCVMQDDVLLRTLSARECLLFSARLRLPSSMTRAAKEQRVEHLIVQLGLEKCANTRVYGLSGGERKRTAIGVELVTDPRLLFLDEPTSGLDSATALNVMQIVTRLARDEGRTVVTTIHQPSSEIFALFHRLMLLANGRTAYDGPASDAIAYFSELGYPCPMYSNPADFFIKVLSRDDDPQYHERVARITEHFQKLAVHGKALGGSTSLNFGAEETVAPANAGVPLWEEFGQLCLRSSKTFIREPLTLRVRFIQAIVLGLLIALFFYGLGDLVIDIKGRFGAIFIVLSGQIVPAAMTLVLTWRGPRRRAGGRGNTVPIERAVFMREQDNRMYRVNSYYTAKVVSEMPFMIILPLVFCLVCYWLVGFNTMDASRFWVFYLCLYLATINAQSLGLMMGCAISEPTAALAATPAITIPLMLLAGFFVDLSTLPTWFSWLAYLSPFKYGFEMLSVNEFAGLPIECAGTPACPVENGDQVLEYLGLSYENVWNSIVMLLVLTIGWHLIACGFLHLAYVWRAVPGAGGGGFLTWPTMAVSFSLRGAGGRRASGRVYRRRHSNVRE